MNGCMCGCGDWGYRPPFAHRRSRVERIGWLEEYKRDLEERAADVADEIKRLKQEPRPEVNA